MDIGNRLYEARTAKGLSQGDIEKRTGLLRCYTSRVENGHTVPSLETLERMAKALEIETYQLFLEGNKEEKRWASRVRGLKREPLAPRQRSRGFLGLRKVSFAANAKCEQSGRPWYAGRPHESCECSLGSALRGKLRELMVVAVEPLSPGQSGRASWPDLYDSPLGFHGRSKHVLVEMFSRHTSGVVREIE